MNMYEICLLHARSDRVLRSAIADQLEAAHITMMEWLLLGVVAKGSDKGSSMSDIAKSLCVTLPQVTALVNKLLPLKLVNQKSASSDRRSRLVSLTAKGQMVFDDSAILLDAIQHSLFGLSEAEQESYTKALINVSAMRP